MWPEERDGVGSGEKRQHRCSPGPGAIHGPRAVQPLCVSVCIQSPENTSIDKNGGYKLHTRMKGCDEPQANILTFLSNFQTRFPLPGQQPHPTPVGSMFHPLSESAVHLLISSLGETGWAGGPAWPKDRVGHHPSHTVPSIPHSDSLHSAQLHGPWGETMVLFLKIFWCGPFLKSWLNLLQYCFCFVFWVSGHKACEILASHQG